jgi:pimeloyl-ACP methyl ester carboxylesterase
MTTYVLVHGAWHGGWCWRRVADRLRKAGHKVFTPTMTGLGDRAHLNSPDIDLNTHIQDICAVFEAEEIDRAVLCGHSYGGMVITGVADRLADRIRAIVYLDAFIPEDGQSLFDIQGPERVKMFHDLADQSGDGWRVPPVSAEYFAVKTPEDAAWVDRRCVAQSIATYETPVRRGGADQAIPRKIYIRAESYPNSNFGPFAERTKGDPGWEYHGVASGHDIMVDKPDELTEILLGAA